jgi:hypothetical protein
VAPFCWGIGLGRTGTKSFCEALRLLGYHPVGHNPPFDALKTLRGGADNGVLLFYKYLDYKFPGSKFVLMLRPIESWLDSIEYAATVFPVVSQDDDLPIMRRMQLYESVTFDRAKYAAAYEKHHADVRRYFADRPDDLLEMNLVGGDGWSVLCPFLAIKTPSVPFPHLHARSTT